MKINYLFLIISEYHPAQECNAAPKGIGWSHLQDILLIEKKQDADGIRFFLSKKAERSVLESLLVFKNPQWKDKPKTDRKVILRAGRDREEQRGMEPDFSEHLVFWICLWSLVTI